MSTLTSLVSLGEEEQRARGLLYTPREIAQQPETWKTTIEIFRQNERRITRFLETAGVRAPTEKRPTVFLIGAGTSDYIGHALLLLLRQTWGCEVLACPSTDLLPNLESYIIPGRNYLWISFSRSGDSPEGVSVLERAIKQYPGIAHLLVTCNANARMIEVCARAPQACAVLLDDAVNDRSLVMTSSFTNMIIMGQCLAHAWSLPEYVPIHERLVQAACDLLASAADQAQRIASLSFDRIFFVGSGPLASIAKESSLKVLEMTAGQVPTMSETVLGVRHGPMAALNARTLFVCFASADRRRALYARDLLLELGAKQITAERIVVGPGADEAGLSSCCELYLPVDENIPDLYRPALDVIFGQLLGLFCSIAQGLQPDSPSPGGVINRVVQHFNLY